MTQLTKYQQLKMYLPVMGYDSMQELADEWDCSVFSIRENCRNRLTSKRLDSLVDDFIKEGDEKFQEHRKKTQASLSR